MRLIKIFIQLSPFCWVRIQQFNIIYSSHNTTQTHSWNIWKPMSMIITSSDKSSSLLPVDKVYSNILHSAVCSWGENRQGGRPGWENTFDWKIFELDSPQYSRLGYKTLEHVKFEVV